MQEVMKVMVATLVLAGCAATPRIVHDKTGATSTLEQLKGRAVVLTFWVDYCQPCMAQMPVVMESVARTTIAPSFPAPTSTGGTACWWRASRG